MCILRSAFSKVWTSWIRRSKTYGNRLSEFREVQESSWMVRKVCFVLYCLDFINLSTRLTTSSVNGLTSTLVWIVFKAGRSNVFPCNVLFASSYYVIKAMRGSTIAVVFTSSFSLRRSAFLCACVHIATTFRCFELELVVCIRSWSLVLRRYVL